MSQEEKWKELENEETQDDVGRLGRGVVGMVGLSILATAIGSPIAGAITAISAGVKTGMDMDRRNNERKRT